MRVIVSWSGGKDGLLALRQTLADESLEIVALVTTIGEAFDRVSMHGVRRELVLEQCQSLGLPVHCITIPASRETQVCPIFTRQFTDFPPNDVYTPALVQALRSFQEHEGVEGVVYGDIFLADLKAWRDAMLAELGLQGIYPLWQRDSHDLLQEFVASGYRAKLVCVNNQGLSPEWVGRELTAVLGSGEYPAGLDPCGENGEYHTFVYDGPMFSRPVGFRLGDVVSRDGFTFQDLEPAVQRSLSPVA